MTSSAVEARSLSSLTTLAFNPPSYPRNPTHVKHEPLVLYIARVPGSRDVFLTPMKPRDRVVTAEDVQSSLYYLHFDQPEDARLVAPEGTKTGLDANVAESQPPSIPRKPIPSSIPSQRPLDSSLLLPELPPRVPTAPRRSPDAAGLTTRSDISNEQNIAAGNYLQPTPPSIPPYDKRFSGGSIQQVGEQPPPLPARQSLHTRQLRPRSEEVYRQAYYRNGTSSGEQSPKSPSFAEPPSARLEEASIASVTLIRRDPASGAQWNVARIEDPPVPEISSNAIKDPATAQKRKAGAPMFIEVLNPGYSKFLGAQERPTSLLSRTSDLSTMSQSLGNFNKPTAAGEPPPGTERIFRRRLWMEGTKYQDNNFGHRKVDSHDSAIGRDVPPGRNDTWATDQVRKNTSVEPHFLTPDDRSSSTLSNKGSSFRGYVFQSPWNGRCEFSTGSGGSSLKCKHFLPGFQGAASAPPATVSELRFNLPGGAIGSSTPRGDQPKRSSFFRPRHNRNHSATSNFGGKSAEDVRNSLDRLDLSLGQEFAGGGFGGRQAKLGKLIIEDEGLKMVDMLVAANLALWWRVYDKVDVRTRGRSASFQA